MVLKKVVSFNLERVVEKESAAILLSELDKLDTTDSTSLNNFFVRIQRFGFPFTRSYFNRMLEGRDLTPLRSMLQRLIPKPKIPQPTRILPFDPRDRDTQRDIRQKFMGILGDATFYDAILRRITPASMDRKKETNSFEINTKAIIEELNRQGNDKLADALKYAAIFLTPDREDLKRYVVDHGLLTVEELDRKTYIGKCLYEDCLRISTTEEAINIIMTELCNIFGKREYVETMLFAHNINSSFINFNSSPMKIAEQFATMAIQSGKLLKILEGLKEMYRGNTVLNSLYTQFKDLTSVSDSQPRRILPFDTRDRATRIEIRKKFMDIFSDEIYFNAIFRRLAPHLLGRIESDVSKEVIANDVITKLENDLIVALRYTAVFLLPYRQDLRNYLLDHGILTESDLNRSNVIGQTFYESCLRILRANEAINIIMIEFPNIFGNENTVRQLAAKIGLTLNFNVNQAPMEVAAKFAEEAWNQDKLPNLLIEAVKENPDNQKLADLSRQVQSFRYR